MNHTLHDTTWKAVEMGSEGWAVFAGPRMIASNLTEEHARLIASAPELDRKNKILLQAVEDISSTSPNWMEKDAVASSERRMRQIARDAIADL